MRTPQPFVLLFCAFSILSSAAVAQLAAPAAIQPPVADGSPAAAVVQRALAALGGPAALKDVTLTGTVHRIAGSTDETGSITLKALGTDSSQVDLALASGHMTEARALAPSKGGPGPVGRSVGPDGASHATSYANTFAPAAWFSPALVLARALVPNVEVTNQGPDQSLDALNGVSATHLHCVTHFQFAAGAKVPPFVQTSADHLGTFDLYLDPASSLLLAVRFAVHPDNKAGIDIPVEVDFSDYRNVNGIPSPFHIQRLVNGVLQLDITVNSAAVNSGLQATDFAIQ